MNAQLCLSLKKAFFPILMAFFVTMGVKAEDSSAAFNEANKFFEQGKYSEAVTRYQKMVQAGSVSAPLFFNLGNAYLKSGQTGRAIVSYRNAEKLSPRDPDIRANLQFARNQAGGGTSAPGSRWENWIKKLTLNEWTILTSSVTGFWFVILAIRQCRSSWKNSFRGVVTILGILSVSLAGCLFAAIRIQSIPSSAVVVPEAVVRLGPFEESQSAFTLRDGAEVKMVDRKGDWLQITDASQRTGWIPERQLQSINDGLGNKSLELRR